MWQILVNNVPNHRWRSQENLSWGGSAPQTPPIGRPAVAASEGRGPTVIALVGRCRGLRRQISMSSQDDLGQGPACSALAMDP